MDTIVLTGNDTIQLDGYVLNDLSVGDVGNLTFPNNLANMRVGKNGNALIALNEMGNIADFELHLVRGSDDDKRLQNRLNSQRNKKTAFVTIQGQIIKKLGDGKGNESSDTYLVSGGTFQKVPPMKANVEGEVTQGEVVYTIQFAKAARVIG